MSRSEFGRIARSIRRLLGRGPQTVWRLPLVVAKLNHPDFFFVDIGANDGVSNDPIYPFLKKYRWRGLAVEPLPYICDELRLNYAEFDVAIEQAAITSTPPPAPLLH